MNSALLNRRAFLKSFLRRWRRLSSLLSSRARESVHCRGSSGRTAAARPCLPASRLRPRGRQRHRHHHGQKSRSEEHTSELQSHLNLVCRLLLEKKKRTQCLADLVSATVVVE